MKYITVKLPKQLLILTAGELQQLLSSNPAIWKKAVARGKFRKRALNNASRDRPFPPGA